MPHPELHEAARRQPFVPFRLMLATGTAYDIRHPNPVMFGRRSAVIGVCNDLGATVYDHTIKVDLRHVVGIEILPLHCPW
jgi:hypothetical protein